VSHSNEHDPDYTLLVQLEFFEFSTGSPHLLSTTHTLPLPPLSEFPNASVHAEVLGDNVLISVWDYSCKAAVYLVSWKTGTVTLVSDFSKPCFVLNSQKSLKLRRLTESSTTLHSKFPFTVSINSSLVSLMEDDENRLEICQLELDPSPRLQTLCFLELPPLTSGAIHLVSGAYTEWVSTSISYTRTRSSRGYHLPFYSSAIGTIALYFLYDRPYLEFPASESYALVISAAGLVSAIPSDVRNVPWEDWGPSNTHFFRMPTAQLRSVGPFWNIDGRELVVRQYDLRRTRCTQSMAGDKSSLQSRTPIVASEKIFQYDIETHLPYRDVTITNKDLYGSTYIVADREWVVGVTFPVRGFLVHIVGIFRCESDHSHQQEAGPSITVCHVG